LTFNLTAKVFDFLWDFENEEEYEIIKNDRDYLKKRMNEESYMNEWKNEWKIIKRIKNKEKIKVITNFSYSYEYKKLIMLHQIKHHLFHKKLSVLFNLMLFIVFLIEYVNYSKIRIRNTYEYF